MSAAANPSVSTLTSTLTSNTPTANPTQPMDDPKSDPSLCEIGHYVVTAQPSGSVSCAVRCSFLSPGSNDVAIAKSNRLEIRQFQPPPDRSAPNTRNTEPNNTTTNTDLFPLLLTLPIYGRITTLTPIRFPNSTNSNSSKRDLLFFTTQQGGYALISYDEGLARLLVDGSTGTTASSSGVSAEDEGFTGSAVDGLEGEGSSPNYFAESAQSEIMGRHYPIQTHATGTFSSYSTSVVAGGRQAECGPLVAVDPLMRCIALHLYDGFITVIPVNRGYDFERVSFCGGGGGGAGRESVDGGGGVALAGAVEGGAATGVASAMGVDGVGAKPRGLTTGPFADAFHARIEERTLLSMTFLQTKSHGGGGKSANSFYYVPQLSFLHQDARGFQHVITHGIDVSRKTMLFYGSSSNETSNSGGANSSNASSKPAAVTMPPPTERLRKSRIDGGSAALIPVPPPPSSNSSKSSKGNAWNALGGVLILGQRQITYHSTAEGITRTLPMGQSLLLSHCCLIDTDSDATNATNNTNSANNTNNGNANILRYLIGDEHGRIHLLTLLRNISPDGSGGYVGDGRVTSLHLDTLGTASTSSAMVYLGKGCVFVGSQFGDSQLVQVLDAPVPVGGGAGSGGVGSGIVGGGGGADGAPSPLEETTYLKVLEEYDNLGPIVDFDLRPCGETSTGLAKEDLGQSSMHTMSTTNTVRQHPQSIMITASGVSKDGSVRLIRNGVGMKEHAAVEIPGIKGMWSLRRKYEEGDDSFLVQSFVRETRVLGVQSAESGVSAGVDADWVAMEGVTVDDEMKEDTGKSSVGEEVEGEEEEEHEGGALAEVTIPGFNAAKSTFYAGNVLVNGRDFLLQVVEDGVRLIASETLGMVAEWSPFRNDGSEEDSDDDEDEPLGFITVASANESGQVVVALRGGTLVYLVVECENSEKSPKLRRVGRVTLDREVSCIDLHPFGSSSLGMVKSKKSEPDVDVMDIDNAEIGPKKAEICAVGLWDDFSVRLLYLGSLGGDSKQSKNEKQCSILEQVLHINLGPGNENVESVDGASQLDSAIDHDEGVILGGSGQHMMARSLCLATLNSLSSSSNSFVSKTMGPSMEANKVNMLLVGLGDGKLISFVVGVPDQASKRWTVHSRKEVSLGTQGIHLIPFKHRSDQNADSSSSTGGGICVLATGDRPTVVYLTGGNGGSSSNPKLCYSTISLTADEDDEDEGQASHRNIFVNVAAPFRSSLLFSDGTNSGSYSLCVADENTLRLGMIDNIQKLHITSYKLGMTPKRIAYHAAGHVYCVGCIGGGDGGNIQLGGEANMENCVRFFDDSAFEEIHRIDLEPFEMILSLSSEMLCISPDNSSSGFDESNGEYKPFVLIGTAFAYPDEDEPTQGRVLVIECNSSDSGNFKSDVEGVKQPWGHLHSRYIRQISQMPTRGGVFSICPFYNGNVMIAVNSKTHVVRLSMNGERGQLKFVGCGHHGHMLSLFVKSLAGSNQFQAEQKQLAIVGDLMRSISLIEYQPKHQVLEELARDYNSNFCTAIEILTKRIFLGSENFNNIFVLRHNVHAPSEEARVRLDTVGEYHLGEMINKFMGGSLIMPSNSGSSADSSRAMGSSADAKTKPKSTYEQYRKIDITVGSQSLFGTVDGTIGSILGLDGPTFAFFSTLQRAMVATLNSVGDLSHEEYRALQMDRQKRPSRGFIDGDLIETFLDLNRITMKKIVKFMNDDGRWRIRDNGLGFSGQTDTQQGLIDNDVTEDDIQTSFRACVLSVEDVLCAVEEISMLH